MPPTVNFEYLPAGLMLGKCYIERLIGRGGMGAVYLARHLALDVPVAVKVLIPRSDKDMDERIKRFIREARLASRIRHPNMVKMLDVGTDKATGINYIVQEYIGGGTVSALMKKGVMDEAHAVDIIIRVASALVAAAAFKIIHRDIKPENIMLTEGGEVKLMDLGIAKECKDLDGDLTLSQIMMGTPFYVAPEQARNTKRVDARADIYSLGATLYHMLCGQPPYPGETTLEILSNLAVEPVPNPLKKRPDLSPAVAALIMRMMAKDPAHRPANAAALVEELKEARRTIVESKSQPAGRMKWLRHLPGAFRRHWQWLAAAAGIAALSGGLWAGLDGCRSHTVKSAPPATIAAGTGGDKPSAAVPGKAVVDKSPVSSGSKDDLAVDLGGGVTMTLVPIRPGSFMMGSPAGEVGRNVNETQHQVTLTKPFWLGRTEVTQAQWQALMGNNPSKFKGNDLPVEMISWEEAVSFCKKLTDRAKTAGTLPAGCEYRLPTEAEWEYACRAGTVTKFCFGDADALLGEYAWYKENSEGRPHPVGEKKPNAWGLYDMHGNVWEWCYDLFGAYPAGAATDPIGIDKGTQRVHRGGGWGTPQASSRRAAFRFGGVQDGRDLNIGFRVALAPALRQAAVAPAAGSKDDLVVDLGGGVTMPLVPISPGSFMMGSPAGEVGRNVNETQHQVTLTKSFWLGRTEVTQAQWQALMGNNPSKFKGNDLPVEMISWDDAGSFCQKLTDRAKTAGTLPAGCEYRLPTEAEWEYACRAGTVTKFCFGDADALLGEYAWYKENSEGKFHPVGEKKTNAWGLYDMHGNAWEWCYDLFGDYPAAAVTDPMGSATGTLRVNRGGSWSYGASYCRPAYRVRIEPGKRFNGLGFRVALAPALRQAAAAPGSKDDLVVDLGGGVTMPLVPISPGSFMMGSPAGEVGRNARETQHQVILTKPFWLGRTEVTQAQWQALMGNNPSEFKGNDLPVEMISWEEAGSFCKKLTDRAKAAGTLPAGCEYRLPTEAEREYACRAGSATAYSFGDSEAALGEYAWYKDNSDGTTHPVGEKKPNVWGLYDMHGNVFEWCLDWFGDYPAGAATDPTGPATGAFRVGRGGGWRRNAGGCRAADRMGGGPGGRNNDLGFRVALAPVINVIAAAPGSKDNLVVDLGGGVTMPFVLIRSGSFQMGSEKGDANEKPVRQVTISKPFYMGKYEVTQEQWERVMGGNPSTFKGAKYPVENVSWNDCQKFVVKLKEKEPGQTFRLPTEAEWEYACRAGSATAFCFGDAAPALGEYAWSQSNSGKTTHPVGEKKPNAWGLYDMHGNVWEWCADWYGVYPNKAVSDPVGPPAGSHRAIRGGSWLNYTNLCRSAARYPYFPASSGNNGGLRLVMTVP